MRRQKFNDAKQQRRQIKTAEFPPKALPAAGRLPIAISHIQINVDKFLKIKIQKSINIDLQAEDYNSRHTIRPHPRPSRTRQKITVSLQQIDDTEVLPLMIIQ